MVVWSLTKALRNSLLCFQVLWCCGVVEVEVKGVSKLWGYGKRNCSHLVSWLIYTADAIIGMPITYVHLSTFVHMCWQMPEDFQLTLYYDMIDWV